MPFERAENLEDVIKLLRDVLDWTIEHRDRLLPYIGDQAKGAWDDLLDRDAFQEIINAIKLADYDVLDSSGLLTGDGAGGAQMRLKLASLNRAVDEFRAITSTMTLPIPKSVWKKILKWLLRILKRIDILLESILKALGVTNPVEELKKVIEEELEDLEEDFDDLF